MSRKHCRKIKCRYMTNKAGPVAVCEIICDNLLFSQTCCDAHECKDCPAASDLPENCPYKLERLMAEQK